MFVQVLDEICFRIEFPRELLGGHVAERVFIVVRILIPLHDVDVRILNESVQQNTGFRLNTESISGNVLERYLDHFHNSQKSGSEELL